MTAAFNQEDDDALSPREATEGQEVEVVGLSMIGTVPLHCVPCRKLYFVKDLTSCPFCESSQVIKAAVIHYAERCDVDFQDKRYKSKSQTSFEKTPFRVPCQIDVALDFPKPTNLTSELDAVTCPRCLDAAGKKINEIGQLITTLKE